MDDLLNQLYAETFRRSTALLLSRLLARERDEWKAKQEESFAHFEEMVRQCDDLRARLADSETLRKATLDHFDQAFNLEMVSMLGLVERDHVLKMENRDLRARLAAAEARAESLEADKRILDWLLEAENADIQLIMWPGKKRLTTRADINAAIAAQEGE
jgi:hypothetical protein